MKKTISAMTIVLSLLNGMTMCSTKNIGFVNMQDLMYQTKKGQEAAKKINEVRDKYSSEINTDLVRLKTAGEELKRSEGLKTREAVEKEVAKLRDQEAQLQTKAERYEKEWKEKAQRESQTVFEEARVYIKEIEKENSIRILDSNAAPTICENDEDNYTAQVKSMMDAKYDEKVKPAPTA